MDIVGEYAAGGRLQESKVRLGRTAEVTPTGVGICAAGHPDIGDAFGPVEQVLRDAFITSLFQGLGEGTPGIGVTRLHMKQAGLALPEPTKRPLRTGRRPVSSQDTSLQHSGDRRSYRRRTTLYASKRGEQRCGIGSS